MSGARLSSKCDLGQDYLHNISHPLSKWLNTPGLAQSLLSGFRIVEMGARHVFVGVSFFVITLEEVGAPYAHPGCQWKGHPSPLRAPT
jgi:hypothetical protein